MATPLSDMFTNCDAQGNCSHLHIHVHNHVYSIQYVYLYLYVYNYTCGSSSFGIHMYMHVLSVHLLHGVCPPCLLVSGTACFVAMTQEYCQTPWSVLQDRFQRRLYPYADSYRLK